MTHLANIYEKYKEVGREMLDVDRDVDDNCDLMDDATKMVVEAADVADDAAKMVIAAAKKTEVTTMKLEKAWEKPRNVAEVYDKVEGDMSAELVELKSTAGATAAATLALSCGTGDRTENEKAYLDESLTSLRTVAAGDMEEDGVSRRWPSRQEDEKA